MRVLVDGDHIVARVEHIRLGILVVEGGHVFHAEGDLDGFALAGLDDAGLGEGHQVGGGLFNAAVHIRRVVVYFHHVLAGHSAGVGHGHVEGEDAVGFGDVAHLLLEGGIAQAVAEGIHNGSVIVDLAFRGGGFIPAVAHVDAFHVVHKVGGDDAGRAAPAGHFGGHIFGVGVHEFANVVIVGGSGQVGHEGVDGAAGGIDLAHQDIAQGVEAGLAGAGGEDDGLDAGIIVDPAQFHGIGGVDHHDNLVKRGGDFFHHRGFAGGQLQIMLGGVQVFGVFAQAHAADAEHAAAVIHESGGNSGIQGGGQVSAFAAGTGDDNDRGVGIALGLVDDAGGVIFFGAHFGNRPVLAEHADHGTGGAPVGVGFHQVGVVLDARVLQALEQTDGFIQPGQGAGAGAAVDGIGGRPAEGVHLGVGFQRQQAVVLKQHKAFVGNVLAQVLGGLDALFADVPALFEHHAHHAVHGAGEDQVHHQHQRQDERHPSSAAHQAARRLLDFDGGNGHDDGQHQADTDRNQVVLQQAERGQHVVHVDSEHVCSSFCIAFLHENMRFLFHYT